VSHWQWLTVSILHFVSVQRALDEMDSDGNGTVEFEEFLVWFTADDPSVIDVEAERQVIEEKRRAVRHEVQSCVKRWALL